jgi:hypothetical protein
MRLIHTRTLELREFFDDNVPKYAILTHTWGNEEVGFQEWNAWEPSLTTKAGYHKIRGACNQALRGGLQWIWVDTNCIDKSSSAELSEAINSMYTWYRNSEICYAFLSDVPDVPDLSPAEHDPLSNFRKSRWFTRGWTLQELIAPPKLIFYSKSWTEIGERSTSLSKTIAKATGIDELYLTGERHIGLVSAGQKMSWLSRRRTSRLEDMAYCMLGIFDVNMPLLYGEGAKAFIRLQEEIVKISDDHTIFCWNWDSSVPDTWASMLAPSPKTFEYSGVYETARSLTGTSSPYSITNVGLSIDLPVMRAISFVFVVLNAKEIGTDDDKRVCIPLKRLSAPGEDVIVRSRFPRDPLILMYRELHLLPKQQLFVKSRPFLYPIESFPQTTPLEARLLLLDRQAPASMFNLDPLDDSLRLAMDVHKTIQTYPSGIFDLHRSLLALPPVDDKEIIGAALLHARQLKVPYFICFAALKPRNRPVQWLCEILPASTLREAGFSEYEPGGSGLISLERLFLHLLKKVKRANRRDIENDLAKNAVHSEDGRVSVRFVSQCFRGNGGEIQPTLISGYVTQDYGRRDVESDSESVKAKIGLSY